MMPHTVHLGVSTGTTLLENNLAAQIKSLKTPFNSAIHHKKNNEGSATRRLTTALFLHKTTKTEIPQNEEK